MAGRRGRTPYYLRSVLPLSIALAVLVLVLRLVPPREIPSLLDIRLLGLFFVLILAAECARLSRILDAVVHQVLSRVRSERALAVAAVLLSGSLAAVVTNDVALLLVVPFTLAFERAASDFDPSRIVVLEIAAANLIGCVTPTGNPQNLYLFRVGGFTPARFFLAQLPWVLGMGTAILLLVPLLVRRRSIVPPLPRRFRVHRQLAAISALLLCAQLLAIFGVLPRFAPLVAALPTCLFLGRRLLRTDFSLVGVFSALFIGIEGLRRSSLVAALDPVRLFGATPTGFILSGAVASQAVSNVPAAMLLAPAASAAGGGALFTALLYGVNAGGSGTPIASLANLIGADLYLRGRVGKRSFWRSFLLISGALLLAAVLLSVFLIRVTP